MRRLLVAVTLFVATILVICGLFAQDFKLETQGVKERQKQELKTLKLQHKYQKQSMKDQDIPKSLRTQMKHKMQREEQELRQRHKHELQELKDQQRVIKEAQSQL